MAKKQTVNIDPAQTPDKTVKPVTKEVAVFVIDDKPITVETLKKRVADYQALEIKDIKDKTGVESVRLAKADLVTTRNRLDEVRKEYNRPDQNRIDARNKLAKELNEIMNPAEVNLKAKLEAYDKLVQAEKDRKAEELRIRNEARKQDIIGLGYELDETLMILVLPDRSNVVNMALVESMTDNEYKKVFKTILTASETFKVNKAESDRLDAIEETRLEKLADIESKYEFVLQLDLSEVDLRTINDDDFLALLIKIGLEYETEQQRLDNEKAKDELKLERTTEIKSLYETYGLPIGFFTDTDAIVETESPEEYRKKLDTMIEVAKLDKKRRDDDATELALLRTQVAPAPTLEDEPLDISNIRMESDTMPATYTGSDQEIQVKVGDTIRVTNDTVKVVSEPETVSQDVIHFLMEHGSKVKPNGKLFVFLPYYTEIIDSNTGKVKLHKLGQLPQELVDEIEKERTKF